jgi:hypothetical protein
MNRWLKLVGVLLIAGIFVAVVSPEFDSPVTVASVSKATQRPHFVVAFAVIKAVNRTGAMIEQSGTAIQKAMS